MYIRHQPLFSFETLLEYQPKTRLALLFEILDFHPCLKALPAKSIRGPKGFSAESMLRALVAKQLYQIPTFSQLVERLEQDLSFAYDCGFSLCRFVIIKSVSKMLARHVRRQCAFSVVSRKRYVVN